MLLSDLPRRVFAKYAGINTEINERVAEFAYKRLNHLPFAGGRNENYELMISGMPYDNFDPILVKARMRALDLLGDYGDFKSRNYQDSRQCHQARHEFLKSFLGHVGNDVYIEFPFKTDYGFNTCIGNNFHASFGLTILDTGIVKIGNNVLCGPNVTILTATLPCEPTIRGNRLANGQVPVQSGHSVVIEDDVYMGANSTVIPGITIGAGSYVDTGSLVTKDIPPFSVVAGSPAKVVATVNPLEKDCDVQAILRKYQLSYVQKSSLSYILNGF